MKPTHELVDQDEPHCLYCNGEVDLDLKSRNFTGSHTVRHDIEILTCRQCKEVFEIYSLQDEYGDTELTAFAFTCKDICVQHVYNDGFVIGNRSHLYSSGGEGEGPQTELPAFDVDFSDKEKLWEKLRTYLVFS